MIYHKIMIKILPYTTVLIIVAIALFLAASNIQGGWLYVLDSIIWSLLFVSFIIPFFQFQQIKFERIHTSKIFENQSFLVSLNIKNISKKKIINFIEIKDNSPQRLTGKNFTTKKNIPSKFILKLLPGEKESLEYNLTLDLRGVYLFSYITVTSYGPFGLFEIRKKIKLETKIKVYPVIPVIHSIPIEILQTGKQEKYSNLFKKSDSGEIYNIREYRSGDNKKSIHWKISAKLNKLMVKELEDSQTKNITIIIDLQKGVDIGENKKSTLEYSVKIAGTLIKYCISSGYTIEVISGSPDKQNPYLPVTPRIISPISNWYQALDWLICLQDDTSKSLLELIENNNISTKNIVIIIFPFLKQENIDLLNKLAKQNYKLIVYAMDIKTFDENIKQNLPQFKNIKFYNISANNELSEFIRN